jgi:hypothetical protein
VSEGHSGKSAEASGRPTGVASDAQALAHLRKLTAEQPEPCAQGLLADVLFREGAGEAFRDGYVFRSGQVLRDAPSDQPDWGYWSCDIADCNRLAWSDKVYRLFGLPTGAPVEREWTITRYSMKSRSTLQRVRDFALHHAVGFLLDAEIEPAGARRRWIRVLALPVSEGGRIVRLQGVIRPL